jgi:MFS family permease
VEKPYIELRTRNNFGDIINNYFLWLKYNFKPYTNLYLRYNAISIILTLMGSYLLVTGFMGLASRDFRFGMGSNIDTDIYLYGGLFVLVIILGLTAILNYSFSSAYMIEYVTNSGKVVPKNIWTAIKNRIGAVILFIIIGFFIYVGYLIASVILAFIPLLGMLAQYAISFTLSAFFGLAFTALFIGNKTVTEALNEGWTFTFSNFVRVVFYGLIVGILNLMITMLILSVPGFILGIYMYFSIESAIDVTTSVFATIIFTISFALFILAFIYTQALSQIAFGVLYFNLHEEKYNIYLRERIEQIGVND